MKKEVFCDTCDKKILKYPSQISKKNFCSIICFKEFEKVPQNNPSYKDGRKLLSYSCIDCSNKISSDTFLYKGKRCKSCSRKGSLHHNYGKRSLFVTSPLQQLIRGLSEYNEWRTKVFQRDNYRCVNCQINGRLNVDHIVPFNILFKSFITKYNVFSVFEDREILLKLATTYEPFWNIENGRTLCIDCHKQTETYGNVKCKEAY